MADIIHNQQLIDPTTRTPVIASNGSTSIITRFADDCGWVVKRLRTWNDTGTHSPAGLLALQTEVAILQKLTGHPRVVEFGGEIETPRGLRIREAVNGDLQAYLLLHWSDGQINGPLRSKWCRQAAEALVYIHSKNVIHCDLRPDNYLLDNDLNLLLCDFGGSVCGEIDGNRIPDPGFIDPRLSHDIVTPAVDLFSLGSVMYIIMTGYYPHGSWGPPSTLQEQEAYESRVSERFKRGQFPDVKNLDTGNAIMGCWTARFGSSAEVLIDLADGELSPSLLQHLRTIILSQALLYMERSRRR